jgi:hypothetical protein
VARVGGDSAAAAVVGFGGVDDAGLDGVAHGVFSGQQLASQPWNRTTDRRLAAALAAAEAKLLAGPVRPSRRAARTALMPTTSRSGCRLVAQCGDLRGVGGELFIETPDVGDEVLGQLHPNLSVTSILGHDLLSGIFRPLGLAFLLLHVGQLL